MILVTVGTHHQPFDRLVSACSSLAALDRVVVQRGTSRVVPGGCEVHDEVPAHQLVTWMREASVVVCHAGPATIFEAMDTGHRPYVVPRDPLHHEHVDDHQLRFSERLGERVHRVLDPAVLVHQIRGMGASEGGAVVAPVRAAFVAEFERQMDSLARLPRRDRFRRIANWLAARRRVARPGGSGS